MENNNMNEQQTNWQQALNEFSDQPQQPQQYAQQAQPQFNQQAQPQQYAPVSYTHLVYHKLTGFCHNTLTDISEYNADNYRQ